ncbi:hypothetical protein L6452_40610 [Arctium lappa]|uniref:Uncharacterized protein n=1 Tax=Arctium lappa TaxID=4217 RepID=A0ACB8XLR8_ARCLA|nr:hypothetical protein L6452_40610 [Arctium lappa]
MVALTCLKTGFAKPLENLHPDHIILWLMLVLNAGSCSSPCDNFYYSKGRGLMACGIVSRLSVASEVQALCNAAIQKAEWLQFGLCLCNSPVCMAKPSQVSKCTVTDSMIYAEVDQDLKLNIHEEPFAASANVGNLELQAVNDGNKKSEDPDSLESNVNSLSKIYPIKNSSVDKNKCADQTFIML